MLGGVHLKHLGRCVKGSLSDKEQANVYVLQAMKAEVDKASSGNHLHM